MTRDTLLDVFTDLANTRGEFLVYDDGFRTESRSYAEVGLAARAFAARLASAGVRQGDRIIFWGENRPEWIAALWGAIISGVVVVPIDYRSSADFVRTIAGIVNARVVLTGDAGIDGVAAVWPFSTVSWTDTRTVPMATVAGTDTAEIIFTSGATADPKGVVLTHRNILANTVPIEREVLMYRKYGRPFFPLRFLNLLPLSHMFGQAMATFIPPMLPGTTVFMRSLSPHDIIRQIRKRRISVLVSVPKILDVLRDHLRHAAPSGSRVTDDSVHFLRRWWRHRDIHRAFGWKFWACVVGAAPLDPELESWWGRLGYAVIQGYGLTETAPVVTLNHPFAMRRGSVGKPLHGLKVKVAEDGEILVRGDNVTQGYFNAPEATAAAFDDGWLRTGDIGDIDETGRLYVRGRKKEMIVRPDGLNVFPDDVERVLNGVAGVRESAAVGLSDGGGERVHAVIVLTPGATLDAAVSAANADLTDHQRIQSAAAWPGDALPRTDGTGKLKRGEIRRWAQGERGAAVAAPKGDLLAELVARYAHGRAVSASTSLDELGLSSLDRVELMVALEQATQRCVDEGTFSSARTIADLKHLVDAGSSGVSEPREAVAFPVWGRSWPARGVRALLHGLIVVPLTHVFAWLTVRGRDHVERLSGPVIFAANHQSHLDTPVILAALPRRIRRTVAPAMAKEFFRPHFFPAGFRGGQRLTNSLLYYLAILAFHAFPLPQREAGARDTLRYIGGLASDGYSLLIFPEGERAETGALKPFRAGIGMMASRLNLPVVPVRLDGVDRVLHPSWRMARPGRVTVTFGEPLRLAGEDYPALAARVEDAVRALGQ
jgi:long-chain acyl-CoA synthetase